MMHKKIDVDLTGVPETLLIPLIGRAIHSQEADSLFRDDRAVQLVGSLQYDFTALQHNLGDASIFFMARAYFFDQAIKAFLQDHPAAVIVNLGAGLETAFYRVDNGKLTWVDLDLPEVITLRETLLPMPDRVHYLGRSALDFSWMKEVKALGKEFFFFAGGLFMYFTEEQVKSLWKEMANHFQGAELIFDAVPKSELANVNDLLKRTMKNAEMKWGIDNDVKNLESWSPKIKVVTEFDFFKTNQVPLSATKKMLHDWVTNGGFVKIKFV